MLEQEQPAKLIFTHSYAELDVLDSVDLHRIVVSANMVEECAINREDSTNMDRRPNWWK